MDNEQINVEEVIDDEEVINIEENMKDRSISPRSKAIKQQTPTSNPTEISFQIGTSFVGRGGYRRRLKAKEEYEVYDPWRGTSVVTIDADGLTVAQFTARVLEEMGPDRVSDFARVVEVFQLEQDIDELVLDRVHGGRFYRIDDGIRRRG
eukprot:TRINITY_DN12401_c0_g1_i1.p1 TRINITY_DN12401_c0_g1~~TRINITY_DN12401_c0_g1_i1.p1  ORF type:complete len:160 (-),score=32.56 TRINITY_DN12401_c0_g1_i1:155-604(-)